MSMSNKISTLILFLLFCNKARAQDFNLFRIQSSYYSSQSIQGSLSDSKIGFKEWSAELSIPQMIKNKKTILIHTLNYGNLSVDTEGSFINTPFKSSKSYHTISYNLGIIGKLNETWSMALNARPTIASDLDNNLDIDDLLFQASVLAIKAKSKSIKYGFGLMYSTRFGRQLMLPMALFRYSNSNINLDLLLPNRLSLIMKTESSLNYGFEAILNGGLFNNTSQIEFLNTSIDKASYSRLSLGPVLTYKLKGIIKLSMTGGYALARRLEFIDISKEINEQTPENGLFFRFGLSVSPNKQPNLTHKTMD